MHGTPNFVPKWTGQHGPSTTPGHKCINPKCVCIENLEATLGIQTSTTTPFLLCQKWYQDMYQLLGIVLGIVLRLVQDSAITVLMLTQYPTLEEYSGQWYFHHPNDSICSTCYKVHSSIIKALPVYRIKAARTRMHTTNCGCRKQSRYCVPGCECQGCVNLPVSEALHDSSDTENCSDLASNMDLDDSSDNRDWNNYR